MSEQKEDISFHEKNRFKGVVDCYVLHLYCKHENPEHDYKEFPHEFAEYDRGKARKHARQAGWILHHDRTATCPKCNPKSQPH